jgi:hypothetical protein
MAKYIEVVRGENKGLRCYVRSSNAGEYFKTFDNQMIKKSDCVILDYEKNWTPEKDPGCRYRE